MTDTRNANARLDTHEAVCAERYKGLYGRLVRMEGLIWAANGGLIATLITVTFALLP